MKKYPFVKQRGVRDCAGACVQMILKYYDGYMSLDKLNVLLCTSNKGTTAYHILETLRYLGFECTAYKYSDISSIEFPCISHVRIDSYNHYVVLYEINYSKKYLVIADPARGISKISFDDFLSIWTGISINMIPKLKIVKEKEPKIKDFVFNSIKFNIKYLFLIGLLSLFVSILSVIASFFIQIVMTKSIGNGFKIMISFAFVFVLKSILSYFRNLFLIKMDMKFDEMLSMDVFKNIINLPYAYSKNKTTGEVISYFNDLFLIKKLLSHISVFIFIDIPLIIILSVMLLFMDYHIFVINVLGFFLYFLLYLYYHKKKYYLSDEVSRKKALINSFITENISGYETIHNLNIQDKVITNFNDRYKNYLNIGMRLDKMKTLEFLFKELIENLTVTLILIYGIININNGLLSFNFVTLFFLSSLLNSCFREILEFDSDIQDVLISINHIQELSFPKLKKNIRVKGDIIVKNLNYSFNRIDKVLKNVDLFIKRGSKVMVTGSSGSGKSTLFKIIKGYYDDYDGIVTIDNFDSSKYNFENVIYVSSRENLFTGRVKDNLSIKKFDYINNEICDLQDFAKDDNMLILENGFNLSSGQRQRIILSRALSDFNIIIIDEGLDGVDVNMERRILKKLFRRYQSKTIIYISHRLDNLDLFDRFLKLEDGQVVLDEVRNI